MAGLKLKKFWDGLKQFVWNILLLLVGSLICALAINGILIPQHFVSGGLLGLSLVIYYLAPIMPVGFLYVIMNIPLFIAGWFYVSHRFLLYSTLGMFIFAAAVELISVPIPIEDKLLSAILAGIIIGFGSGLILKSLGSSGGVDILAVILMTRFSLRLGTTIILFNVIVLAATAWFFSLEDAIYTMIYLYVSAQIVNLVVNGLSQRKAIMIVSAAWEGISRRILAELNRGCTVLHGEGGYSRQEQRIIYTVVTLTELALLKQIVRQEDANAFVVISETTEVMGHRIGNQPHW